MQVIPFNGQAWVLGWALEELEPVLGSVQRDNRALSNGDTRGYSCDASLRPVRELYNKSSTSPCKGSISVILCGCRTTVTTLEAGINPVDCSLSPAVLLYQTPEIITLKMIY